MQLTPARRSARMSMKLHLPSTRKCSRNGLCVAGPCGNRPANRPLPGCIEHLLEALKDVAERRLHGEVSSVVLLRDRRHLHPLVVEEATAVQNSEFIVYAHLSVLPDRARCSCVSGTLSHCNNTALRKSSILRAYRQSALSKPSRTPARTIILAIYHSISGVNSAAALASASV